MQGHAASRGHQALPTVICRVAPNPDVTPNPTVSQSLPNSKQLDERFDALETRLGFGKGPSGGAAAAAGTPMGKTPGAKRRSAATIEESPSKEVGASGGLSRLRMPRLSLGKAVATPGVGEDGIMNIPLPSPTKLDAKHFRQSPKGKQSPAANLGPYDA